MADPRLKLRGRFVVLTSTSEADLAALIALWNDGAVMRRVGFLQGLGYDEHQARRWLAAVREHPDRFHFSVYAETPGFCGEAYCAMEREHRRASLDIKFVPRARGGGRSRDALRLVPRTCRRGLPTGSCHEPTGWRGRTAVSRPAGQRPAFGGKVDRDRRRVSTGAQGG